jgi:hypothetical protein
LHFKNVATQASWQAGVLSSRTGAAKTEVLRRRMTDAIIERRIMTEELRLKFSEIYCL